MDHTFLHTWDHHTALLKAFFPATQLLPHGTFSPVTFIAAAGVRICKGAQDRAASDAVAPYATLKIQVNRL